MNAFNTIPRPHLSLFRLIVRMQGVQSVIYSLGQNVDDAFVRCTAHILNRQESTVGLELITGDLANPYTTAHRR